MDNVATSVRITATAHAMLSGLAAETGKPKAQIVEEALRALEERVFWAGVQAAFEEPESKEMKAERELWDRAVGDGLEPDPGVSKLRRKSSSQDRRKRPRS